MTLGNSKMHRSKGHKTSSSSSHSSVSTSSSSNPEADRRSQLLREFQTGVPENKVCFDCGQKGPTYVNMTVGAFVCTKCSGILRGITPPHRIKSISMSAFSAEEVEFVRSRGNLWAQKVWLGLYDSSRLGLYDAKDDEGLRSFIIDKYEKKRYYVDPATIRHSLSNSSSSGSTGIAPPPMQAKSSLGSGLIGATLNSRVQQKQQQQQQQPNISVSRPGVGVSNGSASKQPTASNTLLSELGAPSVVHAAPLQAQPPPPLPKTAPSPSQVFDATTSDPFAPNATKGGGAVDSFADFSTANFDTPTPDPLPSRPPASSTAVPNAREQQASAKKNQEAQDKYAALKDLDDIFRTSVVVQEVAPTIASTSTPSTGVSLFGSSPVQPMGGHMHAASASGAISPPTVGNISAGAGGDNWASAWHDSGKMNVSSGSSNRSAVSSPPAPAAAAAAPNPFTASNVAQLNTSPWPSSSGTSPVSQPSKNHHQQQQSQRHVPSQQQQQLQQMQQPAPPQSTFTPQWPSSSSPATNDPFNITNVNLGENDNDLFAKAPKPFSSTVDSGFGATVFEKGAQMNNNGFAATGSASTSSSTAAFDAFLNVIADSANKTAPAAAAAAAPNVDQNPWTSEPPKRSTNPFR